MRCVSRIAPDTKVDSGFIFEISPLFLNVMSSQDLVIVISSEDYFLLLPKALHRILPAVEEDIFTKTKLFPLSFIKEHS